MSVLRALATARVIGTRIRALLVRGNGQRAKVGTGLSKTVARGAAIIVALVVVWPISSKAVEYTFTKIADTSDILAGHGLGNATINANGTVAFQASTPFTSGIFTGSGGPITTILDLSSNAGVPSINDNGTVAFFGFLGAGGDLGIFTGSGGPITTIVDTSGPFSVLTFPAINNDGTVAFVGLHATLGPGIFTGSGGPITILVDESGDVTSINGHPGINNFGTVAFVAARLGVPGVFASSGGPPITIADTSGSFAGFFPGKFSINDEGTVAFVGSLGFGDLAIGIGSGGSPTIITDTNGSFQDFNLNSASINSANTVVFKASLDAGGSGIFAGPDPVADKVIRTGDPLFDSTVTSVGFFSGGLNDIGQVAFSATLADGTQVIVRADPVEELPTPEAVAGILTGHSVISGQFLEDLDANFRDLPSIIVTHGWQPGCGSESGCDDEFSNGPFPLSDLTEAIDLRAVQERILGNPLDFNVFMYTWRGAYQPSGRICGRGNGELLTVLQFSSLAGYDLSKKLRDTFELETGIPHTQSFHFMGHSAGTLVNTYAVNRLVLDEVVPNTTQLTILDAPMNIPDTPLPLFPECNVFIPSGVDANFFYSGLPQSTITYVDNFFADRSLDFPLFEQFGIWAIGDAIPGAAPDNGGEEQLFTNHTEIHSEFYRLRIASSDWVTPVISEAFADRAPPQQWTPLGDELRQIPGPDARLASDGAPGWEQISIAGVVTEVDDVLLGNIFFSGLSVAETSPVSISHPLTVPIDATVLSFDVFFLNTGDGDWVSLRFDDAVLWTMLGESFFGDEPITMQVPIANFAEQSGDLVFTLHDVGEANAEVLLGNFEFLVFPHVVDVDIRPRRDPNVIKIKGRGKIPVAVLSSADFDAVFDVDQASLTFGSTGDEESLAFCAGKAKDFDGDGTLDLLCRFNKLDTGFQVGDIAGVLKGQTMDGVPIIGSDPVEIR